MLTQLDLLSLAAAEVQVSDLPDVERNSARKETIEAILNDISYQKQNSLKNYKYKINKTRHK
jgi:hypothetical protein